MHAPDPVGRVIRIGAEDGLDWNEVEILVIDPKAAFEVENGLLKALSVGILVNPEKVEMQRDGGWVINEYSLAEISLVDHPASYDARLFLGLNLDSKDRMLVRQLGVHGYLANKGNMEIKHVEENIQPVEPVAEPVAKTPIEAEKDITAEKLVSVIEAAPVEGTAAVVEAPVTEPVAEEQSVCGEEEVGAGPTTEVEPVAEPVAETPAVVEASLDPENETQRSLTAMAESIAALTKSVAALTELVAKTMPAPSTTEEVISQADPKVPQAVDETEVDVTKDLGVPVNRTSAVVTEPQPTEAPAAVDEPAQIAKPKSLREAVKFFAESKTK